MSLTELETRLDQIRNKKLATEIRRFLLNLFLLFDDNPPPHIQSCINEILDILEHKPSAAKVLLPR